MFLSVSGMTHSRRFRGPRSAATVRQARTLSAIRRIENESIVVDANIIVLISERAQSATAADRPAVLTLRPTDGAKEPRSGLTRSHLATPRPGIARCRTGGPSNTVKTGPSFIVRTLTRRHGPVQARRIVPRGDARPSASAFRLAPVLRALPVRKRARSHRQTTTEARPKPPDWPHDKTTSDRYNHRHTRFTPNQTRPDSRWRLHPSSLGLRCVRSVPRCTCRR